MRSILLVLICLGSFACSLSFAGESAIAVDTNANGKITAKMYTQIDASREQNEERRRRYCILPKTLIRSFRLEHCI